MVYVVILWDSVSIVIQLSRFTFNHQQLKTCGRKICCACKGLDSYFIKFVGWLNGSDDDSFIAHREDT